MQYTTFNLHFQEIFFVSSRIRKARDTLINFQSPFSGDFLCFERKIYISVLDCKTFNLHFQEIFFVSHFNTQTSVRYTVHFQSPFSGDFLCFCTRPPRGRAAQIAPFNLHFQEIFFVSLSKFDRQLLSAVAFQSPFSGDFLCFIDTRIRDMEEVNTVFQSPFSGDFLCFG